MSRKIKNCISFILNLIIVILVTGSITSAYFNGASGNMDVIGNVCFRFFTIDSNILLGLSALTIVFSFLLKKKPKWIMTFKLIGTTAITVTFLVVCFFLGPISGYDLMFEGTNIYMHLIIPLLGIISFVFFDPKRSMKLKDNILSIIPVLIYGVIYVSKVIITYSWDDFYHLNKGILEGKWYLTFSVLLLLTFAISKVLTKLYRKN